MRVSSEAIVGFRGERGSYNGFPFAGEKAAPNRKTVRFALPRQQGKTSIKLLLIHSNFREKQYPRGKRHIKNEADWVSAFAGMTIF